MSSWSRMMSWSRSSSGRLSRQQLMTARKPNSHEPADSSDKRKSVFALCC